jgi:hypothetical protein
MAEVKRAERDSLREKKKKKEPNSHDSQLIS